MIFLLFANALALSGIAAFYSIVGLMAIFASAPISIAVMGSALEASKLIVASWLYRNWKEIPILMKSYLTLALIILMFLTSMGIFGYLSKAHLDQGVPTADIQAQVDLIDEKIKTEQEKINEARKSLTQLDAQVNETITRSSKDTDTRAVDRSITIRRQQAKERSALSNQIAESSKEIGRLREERSPKAAEIRKVEAEVGPIKYIASLIYGDSIDQNLLEKSVRWVIILIVSVFDPLAVIMLIAANWSLLHTRKPVDIPAVQPPVPDPEPLVEPVPDVIAPEPKEEVPTNHKSITVQTNVKMSDDVAISVGSTEHPVFNPESKYWK